MAIAKLPHDFNATDSPACALCGKAISWSTAAAGLLDPIERQLFICASHLDDPGFFVSAWAQFVVRERSRFLESGIEPIGTVYEGWL